MQPLEETQRRFFAALQMPLRGRSRRSTDLPPSAEDHSRQFLDDAALLLKSDGNLSAAERLELYHRQYWFRLLDSIAEDFPTLRKIAGEQDFWSLIEAYLCSLPSESYTLRHLGSRLAGFIESGDAFDATPRLWFAALARLEYARMECYEASAWPAADPSRLAHELISLQPHVRLLELPVPADLCAEWMDFQPVFSEVIHLAVWRGDDGGADQERLAPVEYELLQRLRFGGDLASLFAAPVATEPDAGDVETWFAKWQSRGWIAVAPAPGGSGLALVPQRPLRDTDWSRIDKMGSQARSMED